MPESSTPGARRRRVPAMAPEARRAAIIAATVPLLREHGLGISTRQIATAAGVAEGTLFGVFPDKGALIRASVISTFDPEPALAELDAIDRGDCLRDRMVAALDILQRRFARNAALLAALRAHHPYIELAGHPDHGGHPDHPADGGSGLHEFLHELKRGRTVLLDALAELVEPDRAALRHAPETVAHLMFMLMMTNARGILGEAESMDSRKIVELLLDGLLRRPGQDQPARTPAAATDVPSDGPAPDCRAQGVPTPDTRTPHTRARDAEPRDEPAGRGRHQPSTNTTGERPA